MFFDVAGFPAVLRSDRGSEFTSEIVKAVNKLIGIDHAFGSAFHPQSQGYIEARHKVVNQTLAAFARAHPSKWARRCKLCQWAMRATPRADRDGKSPYELITGLRPQGPLNQVFGRGRNQVQSPYSHQMNMWPT